MTAGLTEDICVVQSIGYFDDTNWVCKLNTALNDLKQFARVWEAKLIKILIAFGLVQNPIDQSVFIDEDIAVVVHVNDLLIFNKSAKTAEKTDGPYKEIRENHGFKTNKNISRHWNFTRG